MITIAAACALGIIAEKTQSIALAIVGLIALAACWRLAVSVRWRRWTLLMVLVAMTAAGRSAWDEADYQNATLKPLLAEEPIPAIVVGRVTGLVQRVAKRQEEFATHEAPWITRFHFTVTAIRQDTSFVPCTGRLWVSVDGDVPQVGTGDLLRLSGTMTAFLPPSNPGEADMRLVARNLRQHGRLFVRHVRQVEIIDRATWGPDRLVDRISRQGESTLLRSLGPDTGSLAAALVVGRRSSLDPELQTQLLETGTVHLLSVSGLHMGIVALTLRFLAVSLGLRGIAQFVFVGLFCLLFVGITGGRPPVLRAAMLVAMVMAAVALNRQSLPLNSLAFAAIVLMLVNPTNLGRVGVQLSFLAVATLVSCGQRYRELDDDLRTESQLDRLAERADGPLRRYARRGFGKLSNAVWFSLCVTLTTTPLVWLHFHLVTPIAVIANVLLGIPMAIALLSGLVAVACGLVSEAAAYPAGQLCFAALWVMQRVIENAASVPGGHYWLPAPPTWWVAVYYGVLASGFVWLYHQHRARWFVVGSLLWCAIAWWLAVWPAQQRSGQWIATFIDVGHGTSVIVNLPDGRNLLYDCGSLGNLSYSSRGFQEPIWAQGITQLDAIVLSHADSDHYNALPGLLRRFRVKELVVPSGMFESTKSGLVPIRQAIAAANVPIREVSTFDAVLDPPAAIDPHAAVLRILHPPPVRVPGNDNANSLVLSIDYGGRSLVLPGDLEPPGLDRVLNQPRPQPGGVLMAPHHGSLTVDSRAILDWARPAVVIVSGGARAKRPEVARALRERGSDVWVTAESGAIEVRFPVSAGPQSQPPKPLQVRAWLADPW